jgi:hypothetical protein
MKGPLEKMSLNMKTIKELVQSGSTSPKVDSSQAVKVDRIRLEFFAELAVLNQAPMHV